MEIIIELIKDISFSAIAAIGFAAISNPPRKAYAWCACIAAAGHSFRFLLTLPQVGMHMVAATAIASFLIGILAVLLSSRSKVPAETFLFPSLLPMIPGIYAYRCFGGLVMCMLHGGEEAFNHYFYIFTSNGLSCFFIIFAMTVGATLPIFLMPRISFTATRRSSGCRFL